MDDIKNIIEQFADGLEEKYIEAAEDSREKEAFAKRVEEFKTRITALNQKFDIPEFTYKNFTFDMDDGRHAKITDTCKRYVDRWYAMEENNAGILFYGEVGTGKSYFAYAILNELLKRQVIGTATTFSRIINVVQSNKNKQEILDHLLGYDILVLDDLGAQRESEFANDIVFSVIDSRIKAKKPMIITTNLSWDEMTGTKVQYEKRIYDRVVEACPIPLKLTGESRRAENAKRRRETIIELLQNDPSDNEKRIYPDSWYRYAKDKGITIEQYARWRNGNA